MKNKTKHIIKTIEPGSIAEELELEPGDELLRVNGEIIDARAAVCAGQAGTNFGKARVLLDRHDARRHGEADRADEADHSHGQNRDQNFHHSRALLSRTAGR